MLVSIKLSFAMLVLAASLLNAAEGQIAASVRVNQDKCEAARGVNSQSTSAAAGQDAPIAPAAQYQTLLKEFDGLARGLWGATTDEDRNNYAERMVKLSPRFLELAENNPSDPIALDSLVQVVAQELWLESNTSYAGRGSESLEDKAIAHLLKEHIGSAALGEACRRMSYGFSKECERFLRTVVETSPHREVQGLACLGLAQFLNGRLRRLDLIKGQPELARRYEGLFGKDYLAEIQRKDGVAAIKEVEAIFVRAVEKFGDLNLPYGGTVGATADSELNEIRYLSVGMQAPEIEGEDQDGGRFKLSDYRGKVVLLYFWSEY